MRIVNKIEDYMGYEIAFIITSGEGGQGKYFTILKNNEPQTQMYLASVRASKNVIDTHLHSLNPNHTNSLKQ